MGDTVENGTSARPPQDARRRLAWCARMLVIPAAVGTLVLASCASRDGTATAAAPLATAGARAATATDPATDPEADPTGSPAASPTGTTSATPVHRTTPSRRATTASRRTATTQPRPPSTERRAYTPRVPSPRPSPSPTRSSAPPAAAAGAGMTAAEAEVLRLVNAQRSVHGCGALASNAVLLAVARAHSADMATKGYFDHTSPDGRSPFDRMRAAGYRGNLMGENIAAGQRTAAAVMTAWMNSPGHRANILNCGYKVIGIGVATRSSSPYGIYWTQDFGDR